MKRLVLAVLALGALALPARAEDVVVTDSSVTCKSHVLLAPQTLIGVVTGSVTTDSIDVFGARVIQIIAEADTASTLDSVAVETRLYGNPWNKMGAGTDGSHAISANNLLTGKVLSTGGVVMTLAHGDGLGTTVPIPMPVTTLRLRLSVNLKRITGLTVRALVWYW